MKIANGKDTPLNQRTGTVPDVSGALLDRFQPMTFTTIVKTVVNFQDVEVGTDVNFQGCINPFSPRQLIIKPEGQRAWSWYSVFAEPALVLTTDEVVRYNGQQYRVMKQNDFRIYGYVEYEIIEDFTGAGPST